MEEKHGVNWHPFNDPGFIQTPVKRKTRFAFSRFCTAQPAFARLLKKRDQVRDLGDLLEHAEAAITLANIAYNTKRWCWLDTRSASG